jgi:hypothetical protein
MTLTLLLKCEAPGEQPHLGRLICGVEDDVEPVFTGRVRDATTEDPQPKWRCAVHRKGMQEVSALTGERTRRR